MGTPFLGEIKIFSFNFAPKNWAFCNGQFLPINQNQALFSLLGTNYGGNGQTTFALPNLRGKIPIHMGGGHTLAETGGQAVHTLNNSEMPAHQHFVNATTNTGTLNVTTGNVLGVSQTPVYSSPTKLTTINPLSVTNIGSSQAHENRQPFLTLSFCIALIGVFPSQT